VSFLFFRLASRSTELGQKLGQFVRIGWGLWVLTGASVGANVGVFERKRRVQTVASSRGTGLTTVGVGGVVKLGFDVSFRRDIYLAFTTT